MGRSGARCRWRISRACRSRTLPTRRANRSETSGTTITGDSAGCGRLFRRKGLMEKQETPGRFFVEEPLMSKHEEFEELCALQATGQLSDEEVERLAEH